jgi:hypothetical protein
VPAPSREPLPAIFLMKIKLLIFFITSLLGQSAFGQTKLSLVQFDAEMKDTFSFAKQWDYDWDVFKENNGKFSVADGRKIKAKDTTHLYFTAKCSTNVQRGYTIRYCYADKMSDTLRLTFSDGLPAYASTFYIYVVGDRFYFVPKTIYPAYVRGQKFSYEVTRQQLTLNKTSYNIGVSIIGFVDIEFIETFTAPNVDTSKRQYYLKGFIRTPLIGTQNGR